MHSYPATRLRYEDVGEAIDWLCDKFGFTERWRAGDHRAQLSFGEGTIAVTEPRTSKVLPAHQSVMVRVDDADAQYERARNRGAKIIQELKDFPYGERQYTAEDLGGHHWSLSQSIADLAPEESGGTSGPALRRLRPLALVEANTPATRNPVISVMLIVPDAAAAVGWYTDALGARELWNLGGVAGLEIDGAPFFLHQVNPHNPAESNPRQVGATSTRIEVFVDDPDGFMKRAIAAGATAGSEIKDHEMPCGRHRQGGFRDPFHLATTGPSATGPHSAADRAGSRSEAGKLHVTPHPLGLPRTSVEFARVVPSVSVGLDEPSEPPMCRVPGTYVAPSGIESRITKLAAESDPVFV